MLLHIVAFFFAPMFLGFGLFSWTFRQRPEPCRDAHGQASQQINLML
jgi:hypothetical protein